MWQIVKDIFAYLEWDIAEPMQLSTRDTRSFLSAGGVSPEDFGDYRWVSAKNVWQKVEAPGAQFEKVYEVDQVRRRKREVVTMNSSGSVDSYLCKRIG